MNKFLLSLFFVFCANIIVAQQENSDPEINAVLNAWHLAAAQSNFQAYFDKMTDDAVFIGTDATENWKKQAFMVYAKPYFEKGKAWNFTPLQRHMYVNDAQDIAWFDELLDTQMSLCRGFGVLEKKDGIWKIAHYVLSMTVPNEDVGEVVTLKKGKDDLLKTQMEGNK